LVEEFNPAVPYLREKIGIGAKLVGREELDVEPPAGSLTDTIDCLLRTDIDGMGWVLARR
jgi:hypothetical protein